MTRSETWYVVRRNTFDTHQDAGDTGSRVPVALFPTRAAADAHCADLLARARRTLNPFALREREPLPVDVVRALDFEFAVWPPPHDGYGDPDWEAWYDAELPHLSDAERTLVWALFRDTPLYEVAELELVEE